LEEYFVDGFAPNHILRNGFRRIEFWIEGDRGAQIRLSKQEWNAEKIRKKGFKWTIFLLISFGIANVFLAYLISSDELIKMIEEGPSSHLSTLIALSIFTGVFYFILFGLENRFVL
jgi:polyferredoxin